MAELYANVLGSPDGTITTLLAALTTTDGTSILTASAFPAALRGGTCRIRIDNELLVATVNGSGVVTLVTRGAEESTAATHASGTKVRHVLTAGSLAAQSGSAPDADASTKGLVQLAGDLTGTAASPQIAAGAVGTAELAAGAVTAAKVAADVATQAELDAVSAAVQPLDSDLTAIAALTTTSYGRAFLALADAAAGRTALSLGTAATQATGAFDASGAAAAAQAASQPLDTDLTAIAALTTTTFGRALLALADAAAARSALTLGNVDNTSDVNKPVSTAQATADALKIPLTQRAAVNGVATLDGTGLIPVAQLPTSTAAVTRSTTGSPLVLVTDQVGDFAFDAVAGVLYGPLSGTLTVGLGWNAGSATAAINRVAPNLAQSYDPITGWVAESLPRTVALIDQVSSSNYASGTLLLARVFLPKGTVVTGFGFSTGGTAAGTPTHSWMALYDSSRAQLATTADLTTAAIGTFSTPSRTVALTAAGSASSFTTTYSGLYYVGICVVATTVPSLYGLPSNPPMNQALGLAGTGNTSLTGPPGFPASAGTLTFIGKPMPYFGVVGTLPS